MCMVGQVLAAGSFEALQKKLGIPLSEGTVVDAYGRRPEIILIQDVHRHPEAQQHIRAMILYGLKNWGAKQVFLEGAWSGGATQDFRYLGLEDPEVYRANVAAYESVAKVREEALRQIDTAQLFADTFDAASAPSWEQIRRLVQLRLKPAEYADYARHPYRPAASDSGLAGAIRAAESFYELANRRSQIFLGKARSQRTFGTQVLVVGGFHTAAMAQELRKEGVSYAVFSPRVTEGGYEELYSRGMRETINALKR